MCGIGGWFDLEGARIPRLEDLAAMATAMAARGPDSTGVFRAVGGGLVHTRLALVDAANGSQPFSNMTGNVRAVVNGEIYNHRALRLELERKGVEFSSDCDAEVVAHLYSMSGIHALRRLDGEFALAIWDRVSRHLILACDPFRTKPIRWIVRDGWLMFASDSRALLTNSLRDSDFDPAALRNFLAFGCIPGGGCLVRTVITLAPGELLRFERGSRKPETIPVSEPEFKACPSGVSFNRYAGKNRLSVTELLSALTTSVAARLQGDRIPGVWLSGGLDSGLLAALAVQLSGGPVDAFTLGVMGPGYDERQAASRTAKALGLRWHESSFELRSLEDLCPGFESVDSPLADTSLHCTHALARLTSPYRKSIISGEGADELFGGYAEYRASEWAEKIPTPFIRGLSHLGRFIPSGDARWAWGDVIRRFVTGSLDVRSRHAWRWRRCIFDEDLEALCPDQPFATNCPTGFKIGADPRETDLDSYLPDVLLPKSDRAGLACGVEVRLPFLDKQVVDAAKRLPFAYGKKMLRIAAREYLPRPIRNGKKRGFSAPVRAWLRQPSAQEETRDFLSGSRAHMRSWVNTDVVHNWLTEHATYKRDRHREIHALLALEYEFRRFELSAPICTPELEGAAV